MKKLLMVLCVALHVTTVRAEFETGNQLYQKMTGTNIMDKMYALGYVAGVFDAYQHVIHCPPNNSLTLGQVNDVVKMYLEMNPANRHKTADVLIKEALQGTWPCRNRSGGGTRL